MLDFLKGLKRFSIATIIVSAIMGVLFIAFPSKCIQYISLVVGVSLIVTGIISVVSYIVERDTKLPLVLGTISLISGIIVCAKYRAIISIIVVILGIFILTSGIVDMATSIRSIMLFRKSGWFTMLLSVITIIFGIVAITKSAQLTDGIVRFIGAALIVYAVLDLVTYIQVNSKVKQVKDAVDSISDIEVEATEQQNDE
ncbi:HdeD family acid-resistance protein [Eubacterium sp.]